MYILIIVIIICLLMPGLQDVIVGLFKIGLFLFVIYLASMVLPSILQSREEHRCSATIKPAHCQDRSE